MSVWTFWGTEGVKPISIWFNHTEIVSETATLLTSATQRFSGLQTVTRIFTENLWFLQSPFPGLFPWSLGGPWSRGWDRYFTREAKEIGMGKLKGRKEEMEIYMWATRNVTDVTLTSHACVTGLSRAIMGTIVFDLSWPSRVLTITQHAFLIIKGFHRPHTQTFLWFVTHSSLE